VSTSDTGYSLITHPYQPDTTVTPEKPNLNAPRQRHPTPRAWRRPETACVKRSSQDPFHSQFLVLCLTIQGLPTALAPSPFLIQRLPSSVHSMGPFCTRQKPPSFLFAFRLAPYYAVESRAFTLVFRIGTHFLRLCLTIVYCLKRKPRTNLRVGYVFTASGRPP
jgi:hypothetical protein